MCRRCPSFHQYRLAPPPRTPARQAARSAPSAPPSSRTTPARPRIRPPPPRPATVPHIHRRPRRSCRGEQRSDLRNHPARTAPRRRPAAPSPARPEEYRCHTIGSVRLRRSRAPARTPPSGPGRASHFRWQSRTRGLRPGDGRNARTSRARTRPHMCGSLRPIAQCRHHCRPPPRKYSSSRNKGTTTPARGEGRNGNEESFPATGTAPEFETPAGY
mmetsp:Transcript_12826/g.25634  ORF Transcript_12826/g.25634 Transcript_12826/m.25634 type:complete len:216 (+) Transcript_12826:285-932(+)